jgi:hypothetical protein
MLHAGADDANPLQRRTVNAPYRLHELGWLGFERLCRALLDDAGVEVTVWERLAGIQARTSAMSGVQGVGLPELPGPTRIVIQRLLRDGRLDRLRHITAPGEAHAVKPHVSLLVLTDAMLQAGEAEALQQTWQGDLEGAPAALMDARAIGEALDARPLARLRAPWALGVRDRETLPSAARSTVDVDAAHALASVFVPTRAHALCVQTLVRHRFAVLTGPPEMGKTAIARMVALAQLSAGWEAHECTRPDDLWRAFDRSAAQVFVADDAFGSTEYRPDAAERWALELPRILQSLDDRHWLVWTSRPTPLRAGLGRIRREHGTERFPQPAEVQVDAGALDVAEKALILYRHARCGGLAPWAVAALRELGWEIVSHRDYTPERIRRLIAVRLPGISQTVSPAWLRGAIERELREPTPQMAASYHALSGEQQALLLAMLDSPAGPVPERDLARAARRHTDGPLQRSPAELVDRLADHFLRVVPPSSVAWVHPSWRDLLIDELGGDAGARLRFLQRCGLDGALVALSVGGGPSGYRRVPLLRTDADWDALTDRLVHLELDDLDACRLLQALDTALAEVGDTHDTAELEALARTLLERCQRDWNAARLPLAVPALAAWLDTASHLDPRPQAPDVARTWIELAGDETRLQEFSRLAAVVKAHLPARFHELARAHSDVLPDGPHAPILGLLDPFDEPLVFAPELDRDRELVDLVLADLAP